MKKPKDSVWRITTRLRPELKPKAEAIAKKKRWSLNDFIEESIILAIATYEK